MKLKVFVPDWDSELKNRYCTPLLQPFVQPKLPPQAAVEKYGDWINDVVLVNSLADCDIAILKYDISYYYAINKVQTLKTINNAIANARKLLLCTVKGDAGITPPLRHFHLYRWSGSATKNEGNQFALPVFIPDPLSLYNGGQLHIHTHKGSKPLIGFCGQGKGGWLKLGKDVTRGIYHRILKMSGKRFDDTEPLISSTYIRSQLLDRLEQSSLIETRFMRYTKYRNGVTSSEEREAAAVPFFRNILDTQYTLCYRGTGNFSVRLFETLACGRIPIIVKSNNLLPLPGTIDWNKFPVIEASEKRNIAQKVATFHNMLSEEQFIGLQRYAREAWEAYLTYPGFMRTIMHGYLQGNTAKHLHSQ
jgi:hypothetical protein